jgi:hypothetical protein
VKKALLSLALSVAAISTASAQIATSFTFSKNFNICEAYAATANYAPDHTDLGGLPQCAPNACWSGAEGAGAACDLVQDGDTPIITGVPGVFCLGGRATDGDGKITRSFDVNDYVCVPEGCDRPFVQSYRIEKQIAESAKCPEAYSAKTYYQFGGAELRTWWTLLYTSPGTQFRLVINGVCFDGKRTVAFKNTWSWTVVANWQSLLAVLDVMHTNPLGTTEHSCLASEDFYQQLRSGIIDLRKATNTWLADVKNGAKRAAAQDELFDMEALITGFCSFTDCMVYDEVFSAQFPAGDAVQFGDYGYTGIIDSIENPCCCKIIADIEYIAEQTGLATAG